MRVVKEEDFEIKNFKANLTSTNSLINILDQPNKVLRTLNSIGFIDNNQIMLPSKTTYLNSESDVNYKEYPLRIDQNQGSNVSSRLNLTTSFSLCLDNDIMSTRIHTRSNTVACGLLNGSVVLVELETGLVKKTMHTSLNRLSVTSMRWKPSKTKAVITATNAEGSISSFNPDTGTQLYRIKMAEGIQLLSLDYSIDGKLFATGDNQGNIYLYNDDYQKEVRCFASASWFNCGHTNRIFSVKFLSDDHNVMVSGGWEGVIYLWDIRDDKVS